MKDIEKGSLDPETKTLVAQFLAANAPDIRIGDVWKSFKGGRFVTVIDPRHRNRHGRIEAHATGATGATIAAEVRNFVKGRQLWERGGIRVGDVRAMGKASTIKVLVLRGDVVVCDDADGVREYEAPYIAELALISRDGTNAKSESAKADIPALAPEEGKDLVPPQETAEKVRDMLRALGCAAECGPGDCASGPWWVSAGESALEEAAFTVAATGVAFCALRFAPVGSLRARKAAPFDEAVAYRRCAEVATLMLKRAERKAANAAAWAAADELKKLGMTATAQEGRVVLTLSFSPEYARDMGPKLLATLGARKAET